VDTGASCNDNNACTQGDTCQPNGTCAGTTINCPAPDNCHGAGTCSAGTCSYPVLAGANCPTNASQACTAWYPDCDGDHYAVPNATPVYSCEAPLSPVNTAVSCPNGAPNPQWAQQTGDCCDYDSYAYPGEPYFYAVADACGLFDYNCDTYDTPQSNGPVDCTSPDLTCPQSFGCPNPSNLPADCNGNMESYPTATCGTTTDIIYQDCAQAGLECIMVGGSNPGPDQACN
jgi:hypothetical protein